MAFKVSKWTYLIVLALIWGTSFILIKKSLLGFTSFQIGALRTTITGLILLAFGYKSLQKISSTHWKWLALSGFTGSFFPAFLFAIAETEIDSAVASILNSLTPLNTLLMGMAIFKIGTTKRQLLGVIIGFVGTALLILKGAALNPNQNYLYAGFIIASTVMYAANVNIIKTHLSHLSPISIAAGNYFTIILPAIVVLCFSGFFSAETFNNPHFGIAMASITTLSVFGTAMAKVLFNKMIKLSSPVFASSVTYIMPIVALLWGVLDGEKFSLLQGVASLIILVGVYLVNRRKR